MWSPGSSITARVGKVIKHESITRYANTSVGERRELDGQSGPDPSDPMLPCAGGNIRHENALQGRAMTEQWNKYDKTAARKHGKPGCEVRPKSVTIDVHAHVGVAEAAKFVEPHLHWATIPLAHL